MGLIKKIRERKEKKVEKWIEDYEKLPFYAFSPILGMRGRVCPTCFKRYRSSYRMYNNKNEFCTGCGTKIIAIRNHTYCLNCGKCLSHRVCFCERCGTKVEEKAIEEGSGIKEEK
jgi:hypothetical protein